MAWDPDMSDAVAKRPGSKKIYDTRIANRLIADILVVSDSFSAKHPQTLLKFAQGWLEGVEFIKTQPERAYNLIGTVKDFNIPSDLAKTMLGGVKLADYADNRSFMGTRRLEFRLCQYSRHGAGHVSRTARSSNTRSIRKKAWIAAISTSWPTTSPWHPAKRRSNIRSRPRARRRSRPSIGPSTSIPTLPAMSLDSRAIVDELAGTMRAYENTVVDIDGNTDSTGARDLNIQLSHAARRRGEELPDGEVWLPARRACARRATVRTNRSTTMRPPEGREKNRRTDIKVYANPSS